jgi:hypothetical protein
MVEAAFSVDDFNGINFFACINCDLIKPIVMRTSRNRNSSGVARKRVAPAGEPDNENAKRPEGSVSMHRNRINRNQREDTGAESEQPSKQK